MRALVDLYNSRRLLDAAALAGRLTEQFPQHPFGWNALGATLRDLGRAAEAAAALRNAARLAGDAESYNNLGLALQEAGEREQAEASYLAALERRPDMVEAHANLGRLYQQRVDSNRPRRAFAAPCAAVPTSPRRTTRWLRSCWTRKAGRGGSLLPAGNRLPTRLRRGACLSRHRTHRHGPAVRGRGEFPPGARLSADYLEPRSALLYAHHFRADRPVQECLEEARMYGLEVSRRAKERYSTWLASTAPERLRVGLVSGTWASTLWVFPAGVAGAVRSVATRSVRLSHASPQRCAHRPHPLVLHGWTPLYGHDDAAAARLIHADGVHVLFDLAATARTTACRCLPTGPRRSRPPGSVTSPPPVWPRSTTCWPIRSACRRSIEATSAKRSVLA